MGQENTSREEAGFVSESGNAKTDLLRSSNPDQANESASRLNANSSSYVRNFCLMVCYHIWMRVGWIFKTESIMMPAFADYIGGSQAWLRGCLPMLNRIGQSLPPLLASDWLRNRKIKRPGLTFCTFVMGSCFLGLAGLWWLSGGERKAWLPIGFLVLYTIFFSATGVNELIHSTLVGKLVPTRRRGRLILLATTIGALCAVTAAWFLLRKWLFGDQGAFGLIFLTTGSCFLVASLITRFLVEEEDVPTGTKRNGLDLFYMSWQTLVVDRNFRLLAFVSAMMGMALTLFPHYQNLARTRLELDYTALLPWLIAQNLGAAFFSWPTGWLGDRFGYRLVLKCVMLTLCVAPVLAIVLSTTPGVSSVWYTVIFCLLGLTPVSVKAFNNYTLEIVEPKYHPRYLSTMRLCMSLPAISTSLFLGVLIDWVGFEFVFGLVTFLIFCGWVAVFWLNEPRVNSLPQPDFRKR